MDRPLEGPLRSFGNEGQENASDRLSAWLAYGIVAVLLDGVFYALSTFLEVRNWGRAGLTPAVVVGYVAILPEAIVLIAYLHLAREITSRGLWKGAVGYFVCGWVGQLLLLADEEILDPTVAFGISLAGGVGIIGLVVLLFGRWPAWPSKDAAGPGQSAAEARPSAQGASEGDSAAAGCLIHLVLAVGFVLVRVLMKNANQLGVGLDLDTWTFLEFLALLAVGLVYGILFAAAKIRRRRQLGAAAVVLGAFEILTVILQVGLVVVLLALTALTVMANPQMNEDQFAKQFEPLMKAGSIVVAVGYGGWALVTAWFFAILRKRYERDWREDLLSV